MKCRVCGHEFEGDGNCPICGYKSFVVVGEMPEDLKAIIGKQIKEYKEGQLKDIKVSLIGYRWKENDGELIEKSREEFVIGEHIEEIDIEEVKWGKTEFAQQTAGEKKNISVSVSNGSESKQYDLSVIAPDTNTTWRAGVVLKPGFKAAIRIGNDQSYSDSEIIPLKG